MISLKDEYFNRILDGIKKFEFRRSFAKSLSEPFLCVIYVSSPVKLVRGIIYFDKPIRGSVNDILDLAVKSNYPFVDGVKRYLEGKDECCALPVKSVRTLKEPIPLEDLQKIHPNFRPPQSFYCLDKEQFIKLRNYIKDYES